MHFVSEYEIFLRRPGREILYDLIKDNKDINYIFGEKIASMQRRDDGPITVELADGLPSSRIRPGRCM